MTGETVTLRIPRGHQRLVQAALEAYAEHYEAKLDPTGFHNALYAAKGRALREAAALVRSAEKVS